MDGNGFRVNKWNWKKNRWFTTCNLNKTDTLNEWRKTGLLERDLRVQLDKIHGYFLKKTSIRSRIGKTYNHCN